MLLIRQNNSLQLQIYDALFSVCDVVDLDRVVFDAATALRAENNIKILDARHLAAVVNSQCDASCINDKQL